MWFPRPLALPAELCLTRCTHHVITASILLDGSVALWTLLCVAVDPVGCLAVIITLLQPQLQIFTEDGLVGVTATTETKGERERGEGEKDKVGRQALCQQTVPPPSSS